MANTTFKEIHKAFEKSETDLYKLQTKNDFSRYILIRSLTNDDLKTLIAEATGEEITGGRAPELYEGLFYSQITNKKIIEYINKQYPIVRAARKEQEVYLPSIIKDFGDVKCGVRNDNLNDTVKDLVRDKTIKTKADLEGKVDVLLKSTIKGYILWQYYNQVTNDLIEHIFNDNTNIIPTLRKIKYVDFMVEINGTIVPFDLKITHISDDYFDLYKRGIKKAVTGDDDYEIEHAQSEMEIIKEHYRSIKNELGLPNYSVLTKTEMVDILRDTGRQATLTFINAIENDRKRMVSEIEKDLKSVEWWNYKFQGERLFKNNNRFFVFLAYKSSLQDARPLKGQLDIIGKKVKDKLDTIKNDKLNLIRYNYTKDQGLAGPYVVNSTSVMVTE
jgi:hypothetical protein